MAKSWCNGWFLLPVMAWLITPKWSAEILALASSWTTNFRLGKHSCRTDRYSSWTMEHGGNLECPSPLSSEILCSSPQVCWVVILNKLWFTARKQKPSTTGILEAELESTTACATAGASADFLSACHSLKHCTQAEFENLRFHMHPKWD